MLAEICWDEEICYKSLRLLIVTFLALLLSSFFFLLCPLFLSLFFFFLLSFVFLLENVWLGRLLLRLMQPDVAEMSRA